MRPTILCVEANTDLSRFCEWQGQLTLGLLETHEKASFKDKRFLRPQRRNEVTLMSQGFPSFFSKRCFVLAL